MKKNKSQIPTRTLFYLWGARGLVMQVGGTTEELLLQGLTVGMTLEHENLSITGIALQYLQPVGRNTSKAAILVKAAACRTQS